MKKISLDLLALTLLTLPLSAQKAEEPIPRDSVPVATQCCDGVNLIENGDFNSANPAFTSDYSLSSFSLPSDQRLLAGTYEIVRPVGYSTDANRFCGEWHVKDQAHCDDYGGGFLVVKGLTCNIGWKTVVQLDENLDAGAYNFCADFKRLWDCCFHYNDPHIAIDIMQGSTLLTTKSFNISTDNSDPCDWMHEFINFQVPTSGIISIKIRQGTGFFQDGNDFALDNLSLKKLSSLSQAELDFESTIVPVSGGFTVKLDNPKTVSRDCNDIYVLNEYDGSGNIVATYTYSGSTFPYTFPPIFSYGTEVTVTRQVDCPCSLYSTLTHVMSDKGKTSPGINLINGTSFKYSIIDNKVTLTPIISKSGGSVINIKANDKAKIFPNPNDGNFTIELPETAYNEQTVLIYSSGGKLVYSQSKVFENSKARLDLQGVPSGYYTVIIENGSSSSIYSGSIIIK